jgi:hypothetical protein
MGSIKNLVFHCWIQLQVEVKRRHAWIHAICHATYATETYSRATIPNAYTTIWAYIYKGILPRATGMTSQ